MTTEAVPKQWSEVFALLKKNHDEAYHLINKAIQLEEEGKNEQVSKRTFRISLFSICCALFYHTILSRISDLYLFIYLKFLIAVDLVMFEIKDHLLMY